MIVLDNMIALFIEGYSQRNTTFYLGRHVERLRSQYVDVKWKEDAMEESWARENVKVVIGTADKLHMSLQRTPWWGRGAYFGLVIS